jgi:hypothetical protein
VPLTFGPIAPFFGSLPSTVLAGMGLAGIGLAGIGLAGIGLAGMPPEPDMAPELDVPDVAGVSCSTTPASLAP